MAAQLEMTQKRNIIILGRTGVGKKTIANHILNSNVFDIDDSTMASLKRDATFEVKSQTESDISQSMKYKIGVLDTVGPYSAKVDMHRIFKQMLKEFAEGINLIIFTFRNGVNEVEEIGIYKSILKNFNNELTTISALVITGCESLDDDERENLIKETKEDDVTKDIAKFMGKGIIPVGFPRLENIKQTLKEEYRQGVDNDASKLQDLAKNAGEVSLEMNCIMRKQKEWRISDSSEDKGGTSLLKQLCNFM